MFLDTLNALMDRRGLTKSALAKESGIPYTTIDGWYKRGADDIRLSTLRRLANFFGVTIDELLGRDPLPAVPQVNAITSAERSYLSKVRALDDSGRVLVKMVIDHEHERCSAPAEEAVPADDDSNVVNLTGLFPHLGLASAGPGALAQDAPVDWEQRSHAPRGATATMTIKGHSMEPLYHDGDLIWVDTTRPAEEGEIGVFAVDGQTYCKRLRYVNGRAVLESINPACGNIIVTQDDARQIGRVVQK